MSIQQLKAAIVFDDMGDLARFLEVNHGKTAAFKAERLDLIKLAYRVSGGRNTCRTDAILRALYAKEELMQKMREWKQERERELERKLVQELAADCQQPSVPIEITNINTAPPNPFMLMAFQGGCLLPFTDRQVPPSPFRLAAHRYKSMMLE